METGTPLERDDDYFIDRGRRIEVATRLVPQLTDDGRLTGIVGLKFDISERKAAERALVEEKERAEVTLHSIGDAVMTTDSRGRVIYMNPAARALVGGTGTSIMHTTVDALLPLVWEHNGEPADNLVRRCLQERRRVHRGTHVLVRFEDGREYSVQDSASPLLDPAGEPVGAVLVLHDVTAMHTITRQLEFQATHDPLTGLLNRRAFETHLQQVLGHATGSPPCALLYLDLDNFKIVNDTSGHEAGDELLRHVAQVLQSRVRTSDVVARLGGDEFGIVLESCEIGRAELIAESVRRDLGHHRFSWDHQRFDLPASIGVVPVGSAGLCLSDVLRAADSACYVAKEGGRNRVHVFQPDDQDLARRRSEMHWIQRISEALDDERFCLYGQAIVPLTTSGERPPMTELLLRMVGEEGEVISPGTFVPAAERYCFMPQVDRWVVKTALRELGSLRLPRDRRYAINLSGQSISDPGFLEFVCEHMVLNQVEGSNLCFELTETAAVANLACASRFMYALRERGCRFALDDFGSGMSSFGYLRDLPVDFIKIDGEFVRHIASDPI